MFNLPKHTQVNRVVPKNSFDAFTNTKQKRLFSTVIERIRWTNKLSKETINLSGDDVKEIQIFVVELHKKEMVEPLLDIIDRAIPYHIIFILLYEDELMISTSKKHQHPANENQAVIDWTFRSEWFTDNSYSLNLKQSLDDTFSDFCLQLSGKKKMSIDELIEYEAKLKELEKQKTKLEAAIRTAKQFNKKVELNIKLTEIEERIRALVE